MGREYDIVLFGATGFTGELTAAYLCAHAPAGARIALAGRSLDRLEAVRARLAAADPTASEIPVVVADVADEASMDALAASARVVISTVGPYLLHGEPLVAACARAGTDYVDLCGEPEFVDNVYLRYHTVARESGAR
ncbi:MAG TPA: saccharopine dehydrogenase NADP-binding domain-containing protein, partial [Solirubrobacteraceae bacterium]|nr:saccharopine dehydrogenase NADP-binding domain-containing protein [Solirubrobacteraceae bacterium]